MFKSNEYKNPEMWKIEEYSKLVNNLFSERIPYEVRYFENDERILCIGISDDYYYKACIKEIREDIKEAKKYNNIKIKKIDGGFLDVRFYEFNPDKLTYNSLYNNEPINFQLIFAQVSKITFFCTMHRDYEMSRGIIYPDQYIDEDDEISNILMNQILPDAYTALGIDIGKNCKPIKQSNDVNDT